MSTDNLVHLAGERQEVTATAVPPVPTDNAVPVLAERRSAASLQQRRLQAARDINARIGSLEREIIRLEKAFSHSQDSVKEGVAQLQQHAVTVMADVMRVSVRVEQHTQQHNTDTRQLEQRLCSTIADLGRSLDHIGKQLQTQQECLRLLQERHDAMERLQAHFDKVSGRQAHCLGVLTTGLRRHSTLTRTHIEGLQALHREQQHALLALTADHDLLAIRSAQMETRLNGLHELVNDSIGETRRRLVTTAGVLGSLALLALGLIAWFQTYPTAVPPAVTQQLSGLSAELSQTSDRGAVHEATLETQSTELRELYDQLQGQQIAITQLRTQTRQAVRAQRDMRLELSQLQAGLATASLETGGSGGMPAEEISLPQALPGTWPISP